MFKRIALSLLALIVLAVGGLLLFVRFGQLKDIPVHAISIPKGDTALINHGRYLAHHVTPCFVCHSPRYEEKFGAPGGLSR